MTDEVRQALRQIEKSLRQQELITTLSSIFGLLALLLAAIGIYGTLAYAVAGRTAEIGSRMALGASHWLQSFLFGVPQADPLALSTAILLILALTLLAGYLLAHRAAAIEPMQALRHE